MSKRSKLGLQESAVSAGVSIATVSRVLNGNSRVDPAIQKCVLEAAARLNVDLAQRNKTKALAFLLSNRAMLHAFHSQILLGAEAHCSAHGWDMVFLCFKYQPNAPWKELNLPKVVQRRDVVRAVILAGTNSGNLLELLAHRGITFAVLGNNMLGEASVLKDYDAVFSDDVRGGYEMTRHLLSLGHRRIGFVANIRLPWFQRCYEGYRRGMAEAGLETRSSSTDTEDDIESGYLGAKTLLAQGPAATAILAGNDPTAHGVYKAVRDIGLRIPEDVSVAGCNDTVGPLLHPPLTTTREFPQQLGKKLVELVLNRIANPGLAPQHATIPTECVKRESCQPIASMAEKRRRPLVGAERG